MNPPAAASKRVRKKTVKEDDDYEYAPSGEEEDAPSADEEAENEAQQTRPAAPAKQRPVKKQRVGGQTLEQHRRRLGDHVKAVIPQPGPWCVAARTHCTIPGVSLELFQSLVAPHADSVTPPIGNASSSTPVVVAEVKGYESIGKIFGVSKIRVSTRMQEWKADAMVLVLYPGSNKMKCWWTMP